MPADESPSLVNWWTSLAAAVVVTASVGGVVVRRAENRVPLIVCAAAYLVVFILGGAAVERAPRYRPPWFTLLIALGCAAVWLSQAGSILILMPLICGAVVSGSLKFARALSAALGVWVAFVLLRSGDGKLLNGLADFVAAAVFTLAFSQLVVREVAASARAQRLAADVEAKNQQLSAYAAQVEELATLQERNRIAREIHDGLGHYLTSAHMRLEVARNGTDRAALEEHVIRAQELLRDGLGELRRSVAMLRSTDAERPFAAALEALVAEIRAAGVSSELCFGGAVRPLGPAVEFALYRAAQEALTNVRRHAQAKTANLRLSYGDEHVELRVEDDGVGAPARRDGFGLVGLRERIEQLGGDINIETSEAGGLALWVRVPA